MKATKRLLAMGLSMVMAAGIAGMPDTVSVAASGGTTNDEFIRGVDVSTLEMLEELGAKYYDEDGAEGDALEILNDNGAKLCPAEIVGRPVRFRRQFLWRRAQRL